MHAFENNRSIKTRLWFSELQLKADPVPLKGTEAYGPSPSLLRCRMHASFSLKVTWFQTCPAPPPPHILLCITDFDLIKAGIILTGR